MSEPQMVTVIAEMVTGWVIVHPNGKHELDYFNMTRFTTKLDGYKDEVTPQFWMDTYRPNCILKRMGLVELLDHPDIRGNRVPNEDPATPTV